MSEPRPQSDASEWSDELGRLAAALCEGELTPPEATRLEHLARQSSAARRFLLQYLQLHGELYWDLAAGARASIAAPPSGVPLERISPPRTAWRRAVRWGAAVLAASLMLGLGWWATVSRRPPPAEDANTEDVAWIAVEHEAEWAAPHGPSFSGGALGSGQRLELCSGLAEIVFRSGARVMLQGPAILDLEGPASGFLSIGRLTATAPPEAIGFTLRTPNATAMDLGTQFGLVVDDSGQCEVHTFSGKVQVRCPRQDHQPEERGLVAGQALRVSRLAAGVLRIEELAAQPQSFVRAVPRPKGGSVAAMRRLVSQHPRLIHHYTLEGLSAVERFRDRQGSLHLTEAVMSAGRGEGAIRCPAQGFDETTSAFAPYRADIAGNSTGAGLQSESIFQPPSQMTVELLLQEEPPRDRGSPLVCVAVGTRESSRRCSFLLAAVDHGQLTHLMDGDAPWVETENDFAFLPGEWYYVAGTFRAEAGQTRINTYVANISQGDRALQRIVKDRLVPGALAASRLGIGKGFDETGAHAYPWSGKLDEVALYDAVLDQAVLEQHLRAVVPTPSTGKP